MAIWLRAWQLPSKNVTAIVIATYKRYTVKNLRELAGFSEVTNSLVARKSLILRMLYPRFLISYLSLMINLVIFFIL